MPTNPNETIDEFLDGPVLDREATKKEGREVWVPALCVRIHAGEFSSVVRPATQEDKVRHTAQYHAYLDKKDAKRVQATAKRERPKVDPNQKGLLPVEGDQPPDMPERNLSQANQPLTEHSDITHPEYPPVVGDMKVPKAEPQNLSAEQIRQKQEAESGKRAENKELPYRASRRVEPGSPQDDAAKASEQRRTEQAQREKSPEERAGKPKPDASSGPFEER